MRAAIPGNVQGMVLMVVGAGFATTMHVTVKFLADELHPFEINFLRHAIGLALLIPWFMRVGFGTLRTGRPTMFALRGVVMAGSSLAWFMALSLAPLAKLTALNLSASLFAVLGAIIFLGEKPRLRRWIAIGVGFAGVLVIVRPGIEYVGLGVILVLVSRVFGVASKLMAKSLTRTESSATIVAYGAVSVALISAIPAALEWTTPTLEQVGWIVFMAAMGTAAQVMLIHAYKLGDLGAVEPLMFTRLIWAALFGFILFAEVPSLWTWLGGILIVLAVTYLARGEVKEEAELAKAQPVVE